MKNFTKILIATLTAVVLTVGAAVFTTAADLRETGTVTEAQALLDAVDANTVLSAKAQAMRALDDYMKNHKFDKTAEYSMFAGITYPAKQKELMQQSATETSALLDRIFDGSLGAEDDAAYLAGVQTLLGKSALKGYYDYTSAEYSTLTRRVKLAEAVVGLRKVKNASALREKAAFLKSLVSYVTGASLDSNLPEYAAFDTEYTALKTDLTQKINAQTEAYIAVCVGMSATDMEATEAYEALIDFLSVAYFDVTSEKYQTYTAEATLAHAHLYLRDVLNASGDIEKGAALKVCAAFLDEAKLGDVFLPEYDAFHALYTQTALEITTALRALADSYLDAASSATAPDAIDAAVSALNSLLAQCYFEEAVLTTYRAYATIADAYKMIFTLQDLAANTELDALEKSAELKKIADAFGKKSFLTQYDYYTEFKAKYDAAFGPIAEAGYAALAEIADVSIDEEKAFAERMEAYNELLAQMKVCYLDDSALSVIELNKKVNQARALAEGSVLDAATAKLAEAVAEENLALRAEKLADVHAYIEQFITDTEADEVVALLKDLAYADLGLLADEATAALYDSSLSFDDIADKFAAVDAFVKKNNKIIVTDGEDADAEYAAFVAAFAPSRAEFTVLVETEAIARINACEQVTGGDLVTAYNRLSSFIDNNEISDKTAGGAAILTEFAKLKVIVDAYRAAVRYELEKDIPLSEYNNISGKIGPFDYSIKTGFSSVSSGGTKIFWDERNKCLTLQTVPGSADSYFIFGIPEGDSVVIEYDLTTFGTMPSSVYLGEIKGFKADGSSIWTGLARYSNGNFTPYGSTGTVLKKNAVTQGVWAHIIIVVNRLTYQLTYYYNDELVGTYSIKQSYDFTFSEMRIGTSVKGDYTFSVDNYVAYPGSGPRTLDRFDKMASEDLFILYAGILKDFAAGTCKRSADDVKTAFDGCGTLIGQVWETTEEGSGPKNADYADPDALSAAVNVYKRFDPAALEAQLVDIALGAVNDLIAELKAMDRLPNTILAREAKITEIKKYIQDNAAYITDGSAIYESLMSQLAAVEAQIATDSVSSTVLDLINKLLAAKNLNAQRSYAAQIAAVTDFDFDNPPEYMAAEVVAYRAVLSTLENATYNENSEIFIGCMDKFKKYASAAEALEDYDALAKYMVLARKIWSTDAFNENMTGFDEAAALYRQYNDAFFAQMQLVHIANLTEAIDKYENAVGFIEKQSMIRYMRNYFETEDIDPANEALASIEKQLEVYEESEDSLKEAYEDMLEVSSAIFISTVRRLEICSSYAELLALYAEASEAYNHMNVNTVEARWATEIYLSYEAKIAEIAAACESFVEKVGAISQALTQDDKYRAIVAAYAAKNGIVEDYAGVASAIRTLDRAVSAYNAGVSAVNAEVSVTSGAMCAVRHEYTGVKIVAILFKKIFD